MCSSCNSFSQIFHILKPTWQRSLLGNLCKGSIWKVLVSSYLELVVSMDDPASHKKCKKVKMEPYHDRHNRCYSQNVTAMCDIPFHTTANTLIYCQTGADATHSVKANVCTADTKYRNHMDKQRYRTIRKWKQIGKGKNHYLSLFKY